MSYAKYADVAKAAKDLLSKPYPDTHKVELKATGSNGVVFTGETLLGALPAGSKSAVLTVKGEGVVTGGFKVDKLSVDSNKVVAGEFSLAEVVKGTKFTFKATDGSRAAAPISAAVGVEHKADFGTFVAEVDVPNQNGEASAVFGFDNFVAGAAVKAAFGKAGTEVTAYDALIGFKTKDISVSVASEKKFAQFAASYYQVVSPVLSVAAQGTVPRDPAQAAAFKLAAGVQYKASPDVTLAAKASQDGKVAVSYAQQLSALTKITVGAQVDANNIKSDAAHKLAIAVNFSA